MGQQGSAVMLEGLPPNNATHVMRLACGESAARGIADIVVESFDLATTAAAAFADEPDTASWESKSPWIVEAYFGTPPDEEKVRALVAIVAGDSAARAATFGRIGERDWVASSLAGLKPVRAGRLLIHSAHDRGSALPNDIAIEIEAALAFGTGHHGSTRGCLLMLERAARKRRPRAIIDIGTGSGILAIAAAKSFKCAVHASDIDPICVAAAAANAKRNGAGRYVRPVLANGAAHPILRQGAPYGLVIANILARPLRDIAPEIARLALSGADVILSGLIAGDVPGVLSAYRMQGISLVRRIEIEGWITLLMCCG
jgi:ribosomal protein L11 methyltransferase